MSFPVIVKAQLFPVKAFNPQPQIVRNTKSALDEKPTKLIDDCQKL